MNHIENRVLRVTVAIASLVPICAGSAGMLIGPRLAGHMTNGLIDPDSHFRYLSGLLLAIGLGFASTVPRIEEQGARFQLLVCVVVLGGIGRLMALLAIGVPSPVMLAALAMELIVTPGLALWQHRVAQPGVNLTLRDSH